MTATITHAFVSAIPDGTDTSVVRPSNWNENHVITGTVDISQGGTNATTAAGARTNLGLGTMAVQDANNVAITGGAISGATVSLPASTTSLIPLHFASGVKPTTPTNGDMWYESGGGLFLHNNSYVHQLDIDTNVSGVLSMPVLTVAGTGATVDAASTTAYLFSLPGWTGDFRKYTIPAATGLALTDNTSNYLVVKYNAGSPAYFITTNVADLNGSDVVGAALLYREGTVVHQQSINWGLAPASRITRRLVQTQRYERGMGLLLGETTGRVITSTAGNVWYGTTEYAEGAASSSPNNADFYFHVSGVWNKSVVSTYNNTQYDNGTNLATLGANKYAVNWVYLYIDGSGLPKFAYVLGGGDYSLAQAQASTVPTPPPVLTQMAILIGRIIVVKNGTTATSIDSAFTQVFSGSTVTDHNSLAGLQGGTTNEYYHLTSAEYTGTGTGTFVRASGATLTAPNLGTPSAAVLTNATGLPLTTGVTGTLGQANGGTGITTASNGITTSDIIFVIDGGGSAITTGVKGYVEVPFGCTVSQWTLLADQSGSVTIDVVSDAYSSYGTNTSMVGAGTKPSITTATKNQSAPASWTTTSITAGNIVGFNVTAATTVTRVTIALKVVRT